VGGGAGGVELAFATHHRLRTALGPLNLRANPTSSDANNQPAAPFDVKLLTKSTLLQSHPSRARRLVLSAAAEEGIDILEHVEVKSISPHCLTTQTGGTVRFDECLWCTQASPAQWLQGTDLPKGAPACHIQRKQCLSCNASKISFDFPAPTTLILVS
jgi:NADH dehydrogenase FAD-containing subunit